MEKIMNPERKNWAALSARPEMKGEDLEKICKDIFAEVRKDGDRALAKYTWFFDRVRIDRFEVSEQEFKDCEEEVGEELKSSIRFAAKNIEAFHRAQSGGKCEYVNENGFRCWQEIRGIEKVGLYIPGGSAPLFSTVLMLGIPALIAGCKEVVICTPPDREGKVHPAILWTAQYCGIKKVYKVGGVQAIAALTFGTGTIPAVYKIFGPGNQYVTAAKQLAFNYRVAIDMPAGPSEVMVVADDSARPSFVAADLLSQAEHGRDSQVILLTTEAVFMEAVEMELKRQLAELPRKEIAEAALSCSKFICLQSVDECVEFANVYAPEHLILSVRDYEVFIPEIVNAGSVFLGNYAPESAGDYASGTNHTLPTNGCAKAFSGINIDAFVKKISFQEISRQGLLYLGGAIEVMAENERLDAHRNAVIVRKIG